MKKRAFSRVIISSLVAVLGLGITVTGHTAPAGQALNLITTPIGQSNYTVSVAQGQLISRKTSIRIVVQPAQGPRVIPTLLESGDGQLGTLSSMSTYWAYTGTGDYTKPMKSLRVLQSGNNDYFGLLTRQETGIRTVSDLKGKRISTYVTSTLGKGTLDVALQAYGLNPAKDIILLKAEDTPTALRDLVQGRTDAVACSLMGSKIVELASKTKIVVLPIEDKTGLIQKRMPAAFPALTPSNLPGIAPGVPVVTAPLLLIARDDVSDDVAYQIVKTLIENYNDLKKINSAMAEWEPKAAVRELPIPYHPGAIKYYKEKGLWSSKMDQLQRKLQEK